MEGLERKVVALGLGAPAAHASSQTFTNPLDLFRSCLAEILVDIAECSDSDAQKAIQWPNNVFNGDLSVVLPRLKPGTKADNLAVVIMDKVNLRPLHRCDHFGC
jgi:arginyl-tRNA synthetase